ncbi:hypothetical protein AAC03nite_30640 [Alicyclobacillus acidoterrestris]|uniref:hypothetical protein n=1 Tax=Alicyclobacillus suci TaxID=2816080 RepID=UPI0011944AAF|nr:hypothetical protein [Alicyclobacillus suci]GEO27279.1 hypothetical protein AAC03nite_30640 [Alicyclobacillus acidoterrestris]
MKPEELMELRPLTRKEYQRLRAKHRARRHRRRRSRIRRLRILKSLRSLRFWLRVVMGLFVLLCVAFWARFAFVYDIPSVARPDLPQGITAYVTVKPWWFGPPVFDLRQYVPGDIDGAPVADPSQMFLMNLGKYTAVVEHPQFIWALRKG